MSGQPFPLRGRDQVEDELLDQVQAAERDYREAAWKYNEARKQYGTLLDNQDGAYGLRRAAMVERITLEKYAAALRAFADLVVRGRTPPK